MDSAPLKDSALMSHKVDKVTEIPARRPLPERLPPGMRSGMAGIAAYAAWITSLLLPGTAGAGNGLVVHEWGTFTTLSTSSGELLEGLYVDATRLPDFVHGLPFFNYGSAGWPSPDRLKGVTVKMETPVLYFYSTPGLDITAKVGFQGGTISQWFPQRASGEANPAGPIVDLGEEPYAGGITWKAKVLPEGTVRPYSHAADFAAATAEWTAPRATRSNLIEGQEGEIEKFLFYRGLGNFPSAVALRFDAQGRLVVKNQGSEDIPFLLVFDQEEGGVGTPSIWWQGPLAAGETRVVPPAADDFYASTMAMETLHEAMMKAGLYSDEARALLRTWYTGYFIEEGLKAFWIVPRKQIDRLLPLEITPAPDSLERVIIGRSEILTPEFEARLLAEGGTLPSRTKHKYYLAYLDFLSRHQARPTRVTLNGRASATRSKRPWGLVLPWKGPLASPSFPSPGMAGPLRDLRGRAGVP